MPEQPSIIPVILSLVLPPFTALSIVLWSLFRRVLSKLDDLERDSATKTDLDKSCEKKQRRLDDFKRDFVTREHCDLKNQLYEDRFLVVHSRLDTYNLENKEGHEEIKTELRSIGGNINKLVECVTKLSMSGTCD